MRTQWSCSLRKFGREPIQDGFETRENDDYIAIG